MTDFSDVMGMIMVGMVRARHMADMETAAVAEMYKSEALLDGLTVPRVRIPELRVSMPILIEAEGAEEPTKLQDTAKVVDTLSKEIDKSFKAENVELPAAVANRFKAEITSRMKSIADKNASGEKKFVSRESVAREAQEAVVASLNAAESTKAIDRRSVERLVRGLGKRAGEVAIKTPGRLPTLNAGVRTADVKDKGSPDTVVRINIVLREEGLEWTLAADEDGKTRNQLTPE
jgi:hypothetical protein